MIDVQVQKKLSELVLDVAFKTESRGITAIFGRSGSGKTSLIQAIAGGLRPDAGRIVVDDRVFFDGAEKIDMPIHSRQVGYVFQESRLFPHLSVRSNLVYGYKRASRTRHFEFDDVIDLLGIGHLLDRRPHKLSGGERQRVAIGRALLAQPTLLLMDEPLSSLDPPRKSELLPYIEGIRDELELPILYISHAFNEVVRLADHIVLIDGGKVLRSGPLLEVASDPDLSPIIGRFESGSVLECTVIRHDEDVGLSTLAFGGGRLRVPHVALPVGAPVRVRIRARDVALALSEPTDVSITNRLSGRLLSLSERDGSFVEVTVDVGGAALRSLITRESAVRLSLEPGMTLWALVKTVAMDSRSVGFIRRARWSSSGSG